MGAVMKQIPLDDLFNLLKRVIGHRVGEEVTATLSDDWWFELIEYGIDIQLYGKEAAEDWEVDLADELTSLGFTPDESQKTLAEWLEFTNEFFTQFGLERSRVAEVQKEYTLSLFGLQRPGTGKRFEAWILVGGEPDLLKESCTW